MKFSTVRCRKVLTVLLLGLPFVSGCKEQDNKKGKTLTVGISADYVPFAFQKEGKNIGFEIDLIDKIAKNLSFTPDYKDMGFDGLLAALKAGKVKLVIAAMSPTEDRKKEVDFSIPYHESSYVLLTTKKNKIKELKDLTACKLGAQSGSVGEIKAKDLNKQDSSISLQSMSKLTDLIQAMNSGTVDAVLADEHVAKTIEKEHKELKIVHIRDPKSEFAIAFPKGSELLKDFNKELKKMKDTGELSKLEKKWFVEDELTNIEQNENLKVQDSSHGSHEAQSPQKQTKPSTHNGKVVPNSFDDSFQGGSDQGEKNAVSSQ